MLECSSDRLEAIHFQCYYHTKAQRLRDREDSGAKKVENVGQNAPSDNNRFFQIQFILSSFSLEIVAHVRSFFACVCSVRFGYQDHL